MSKILTVKGITKCGECPKYSFNWGSCQIGGLVDSKIVEDISKIPHWCPLPDEDQTNPETDQIMNIRKKYRAMRKRINETQEREAIELIKKSIYDSVMKLKPIPYTEEGVEIIKNVVMNHIEEAHYMGLLDIR